MLPVISNFHKNGSSVPGKTLGRLTSLGIRRSSPLQLVLMMAMIMMMVVNLHRTSPTQVKGQPVPPRTNYSFPTWQPNIIAVPPSTTGLTYYVDGISGDDTHVGTNLTSALKTISAALKKIVPGDTVLIRGGLYREGIAIYTKGTADKPFTFGSYGDGEVILDGSPLVTGWSQVSPSIWRTTWPVSDASQNPLAIIVNEVPLMQNVDGVQNVVAGKNNWYYDTNTKTITADMGSFDPTISPNGADVIVIRNVPDQAHVFFYDSAYITFKGLTIRGSGAAGIWGYGGHITIERCNIKFNGKAAVNFFPLSSGTNSDNLVLYSHAYHNAMHNWPRGNNGFAESGGGWSGGICFQSQFNCRATGNIVHMTGGGGIIGFGSNPDWQSGNMTFEENVAYDNWDANMFFDNLPNCIARNNIIYNNPPDPSTWLRQTDAYPWNTLYKFSVGLALGDEWDFGSAASGYAALTNVTVTGNYIAGCRLSIRDYSDGVEAVTNHGLKNVVIFNNTIVIPSPSAYHGMSAVIGIFIEDNGSKNYNSFITKNRIYAPIDAVVPLIWSHANSTIQGITFNQNSYCSSFATPFTMDEQDDESFAHWKNKTGQDSQSTLTSTCARPNLITGLPTGPNCDPLVQCVHPVAVMYVQQNVTDCDTLKLDGRQSYSVGPASLTPRWIWGIASIRTAKGIEIFNIVSPAYNASVAAAAFADAPVNTLNASTVFPQDNLLLIAGSRLIDGCTYGFYLGIVNDLDQSEFVLKYVTKTRAAQLPWTPSMTLQIPVLLRRTDTTILSVFLTPSTCLEIPNGVVTTYNWEVRITNALYMPSTYHPAISQIPERTRTAVSQSSALVISPGFWRTGYTYTVSISLLMTSVSGTVTVTATQANLIVTSTAVVAKITNGDRSRTSTEEFVISADQSYDPDFPLVTGQSALTGVAFVWKCKVSDSGGVSECLLPATVNLTRSQLTIPANTLAPGSSYIWSVNVSSLLDGRSSLTSVKVTMFGPQNVTSPLVTILAPPTRINSDDQLRVQATVVSTTMTNSIAMTYVWSIAFSDSSIPTSALPSLFDPANLVSVAVNSSSLVLLSGLLPSGVYRLTVTVTDPLTIDPVSNIPVSGYANIVFTVNSKPQPGECHLSPTVGYAFITPFTVTCSSWYSSTGDEPFTYRIMYATSAAVAAATLSAPVSYSQLTPPSFTPSSVEFFLPVGMLVIRAEIKDQVGSYATVDLSLSIDTPIVVFDLLEYIRNLTEIQLPPFVSSGSTLRAMLLASQIGGLINDAYVSMSNDAIAQNRLTFYTAECIAQLTQSWEQTFMQRQGNIDLTSMNLIVQAMLPLTKYAATRYSNDTLSAASHLISNVISAANHSSIPSILSVASTQDLGVILSNLFIRCDQLDMVEGLIHSILHIRQRDAVAGEEISLSTLNFIGFVQRSLVSTGTEVHLANGQSVVLTATQMEAYVKQLQQFNSSSIDTASYPLETAEMDTRIVTFDSRWNQCRNSAPLSQLTSIELTFPNGANVDIGSLGSGIIFTLPIPKNQSDVILDRIQEEERRQREENCGLTDGYEPFVATQEELLQHFECQFYNTTTMKYSSTGCRTLNVSRVDPPGLGGTGGVILTCQCNHLTEFAILYQEVESLYDADECSKTATSLGDSSYLVFSIMYALVGLIALLQLVRAIILIGVKKYWLITIEHSLMFLMCLSRAFNMSMYYTLYSRLSIFTQSLLSGIPYLFYPWIFTFVIVAWASVLAAASQGETRKNLFKPYAVQFILGNSLISLVILFLFISMSQTRDLDTLTTLNRAGVGLTCCVEIGFAVFFLIYGGLLVHELTKTFVSKHAIRLGAVASSLASAFAFSAALLAFSVAKPTRYAEHFIAYNCVYFSLDIIGLLIVMALFAKSIREDALSKNSKDLPSHQFRNHRTEKTLMSGRALNNSTKDTKEKDIDYLAQ